MNKKNLLCIFLIILVIAIYYYYRGQDESDEIAPPVDLVTQPIYKSEKMQTMIYDLTGELSYTITAEDVEHFAISKETHFVNPLITLYNPNNVATWNIAANAATLTNDKLLYLKGNVKLDNLLPDNQLQSILTDNAKVDLITQIVTSNEEVTIKGISFSSTGTGLLGNLREKTADILENVKTYYNTSTINNTTN